MTTEQRLADLIAAVGADYKGVGVKIGSLSSLSTTNKTSIVLALNEVFDAIGGAGAVIDDTTASLLKVFSSTKTTALIQLVWDAVGDKSTLSTTAKTSLVAAVNELYTTITAQYSNGTIDTKIAALKTELVGGAASALDTFAELATALGNDPTFASTLATQMSKRVRFDAAQTLTTGEKLQACQNIGIGNPDVDLVALYTAAKA